MPANLLDLSDADKTRSADLNNYQDFVANILHTGVTSGLITQGQIEGGGRLANEERRSPL